MSDDSAPASLSDRNAEKVTMLEALAPFDETSCLTAQIVSAYVSHNATPIAAVPDLIRSVRAALADEMPLVGAPSVPAAPPVPAVKIEDSLTPDHLICLEDGRKLKSLKRHLRAKYDMSPEQYRARWGLPSDYPMVAPNYSAARSELARSMGLGRVQPEVGGAAAVAKAA